MSGERDFFSVWWFYGCQISFFVGGRQCLKPLFCRYPPRNPFGVKVWKPDFTVDCWLIEKILLLLTGKFDPREKVL